MKTMRYILFALLLSATPAFAASTLCDEAINLTKAEIFETLGEPAGVQAEGTRWVYMFKRPRARMLVIDFAGNQPKTVAMVYLIFAEKMISEPACRRER